MILLANYVLQVEQILGLQNATSLVKTVCFIFALMLLGIALFFLFTLLTLAIHQITKHFQKRLHTRYTNWLINYLIDPDFMKPEFPLLHRNVFRSALLDLLLITKGHEKNVLLKVYISNGLWDYDLSELRHRFWHRRLAALVRLDQWQICLGLTELAPLIYDDNFQIQQIALKNLSRTKLPEEAAYLLEHLTKVKTHYSVLYETIYRCIRIHRELVIACLKDNSKVNLWSHILKVMGDSKIIESVPVLIEVASQSTELSLREKALHSLGQIGDPRGLGVLRSAITSRFARERLSALQALFQIDFDELLPFKEQLLKDENPDVQSWMNHYLRGGT